MSPKAGSFSSAGVSGESRENGSPGVATSEPETPVQDRVVAKEDPVVAVGVPVACWSSVAPAGVEDLVGKILSANPQNGAPGCLVDRLVTSENAVVLNASARPCSSASTLGCGDAEGDQEVGEEEQGELHDGRSCGCGGLTGRSPPAADKGQKLRLPTMDRVAEWADWFKIR